MDSDDSIGLMLLLQLILIGLNAVFACAEIAVITINDNKVERLVSEGNKKASRLQKLKGQPARFLATIQVAITLSGFLGSAFAADNFSDKLVSWIIELGVNIPRERLDTIAVVFITLILSYFTLVLGELVPKRLAMRKAESLALGMASMIFFISKLFAPIVSLLTVSTNGVLRLLGINPNEEDNDVSEEDIRMMVDAGSKNGAIDTEEKNLIQNIFEFDDLTIGEISTHRTDVEILWLEEGMEEWDRVIKENMHTMYPVCDETVDNIVGVLNSKEYFKLKNHDRDTVMKYAVKPAYFVPENVKADVLFKNMKQTHNFFAVVLDEYGGMMGIVTMNDLIEQIVGDFEPDISEEADIPDIEEINVDGEIRWNIKGNASLDEVEKALGIELPENDCDTFGGFVFTVIGAVPNDGCQLEVNTAGLIIKITEISEHQLVRSQVCLAPTVPGEA